MAAAQIFKKFNVEERPSGRTSARTSRSSMGEEDRSNSPRLSLTLSRFDRDEGGKGSFNFALGFMASASFYSKDGDDQQFGTPTTTLTNLLPTVNARPEIPMDGTPETPTSFASRVKGRLNSFRKGFSLPSVGAPQQQVARPDEASPDAAPNITSQANDPKEDSSEDGGDPRYRTFVEAVLGSDVLKKSQQNLSFQVMSGSSADDAVRRGLQLVTDFRKNMLEECWKQSKLSLRSAEEAVKKQAADAQAVKKQSLMMQYEMTQELSQMRDKERGLAGEAMSKYWADEYEPMKRLEPELQQLVRACTEEYLKHMFHGLDKKDANDSILSAKLKERITKEIDKAVAPVEAKLKELHVQKESFKGELFDLTETLTSNCNWQLKSMRNDANVSQAFEALWNLKDTLYPPLSEDTTEEPEESDEIDDKEDSAPEDVPERETMPPTWENIGPIPDGSAPVQGSGLLPGASAAVMLVRAEDLSESLEAGLSKSVDLLRVLGALGVQSDREFIQTVKQLEVKDSVPYLIERLKISRRDSKTLATLTSAMVEELIALRDLADEKGQPKDQMMAISRRLQALAKATVPYFASCLDAAQRANQHVEDVLQLAVKSGININTASTWRPFREDSRDSKCSSQSSESPSMLGSSQRPTHDDYSDLKSPRISTPGSTRITQGERQTGRSSAMSNFDVPGRRLSSASYSNVDALLCMEPPPPIKRPPNLQAQKIKEIADAAGTRAPAKPTTPRMKIAATAVLTATRLRRLSQPCASTSNPVSPSTPRRHSTGFEYGQETLSGLAITGAGATEAGVSRPGTAASTQPLWSSEGSNVSSPPASPKLRRKSQAPQWSSEGNVAQRARTPQWSSEGNVAR